MAGSRSTSEYSLLEVAVLCRGIAVTQHHGLAHGLACIQQVPGASGPARGPRGAALERPAVVLVDALRAYTDEWVAPEPGCPRGNVLL